MPLLRLHFCISASLNVKWALQSLPQGLGGATETQWSASKSGGAQWAGPSLASPLAVDKLGISCQLLGVRHFG